jgi:hypothetical protein
MSFNANSCEMVCGVNDDTYPIHSKTVTAKYTLSKKCCCGTQESSCGFKRDGNINGSDFVISNAKLNVYPPTNTGIQLIDISPGFHANKRGPTPQRVAKVPDIPLYIQNLSLIF